MCIIIYQYQYTALLSRFKRNTLIMFRLLSTDALWHNEHNDDNMPFILQLVNTAHSPQAV